MFDILKDSNNRFNKKNILPLVCAAAAGITIALFAVQSYREYLAHSSKYDSSKPIFEKYSLIRERMDQTHRDFLSIHIPRTVIILSILSVLTYFPVDVIRKNKQIEDLKANSEPNSRIYNALVDDVSEEHSV